MRSTTTTAALLSVLSLTHAIDLDVDSQSSILAAASIIKDDILRYYSPSIPGLLPDPYYWWEGGLAFDSLINYVTLSGDKSIVSTIQDGMLFQTGPDNNYMPPNQSKSLGNDDQATWALAAMTAAEQGFPQKEGQQVSWLELAKNVFDTQVARWDTSTCDGGLRWQIFTFNNGYNYKNSNSNGAFALLAARLARYTGNVTYSDWAKKSIEWSQNLGLISESGQVFDGSDVLKNCSDFNHIQWTINSGYYVEAGAYLVNGSTINSTQSQFGNSLLWRQISSGVGIFFKNSILFEVACEPSKNCNTDQLAFRAPYVRSLVSARDLIPTAGYDQAQYAGTSIRDYKSDIKDLLQASAKAAAAQCSGGGNGTTCGTSWLTNGTWDGTYGLGQDLAALEVILANLPGQGLASANGTAAATTGATTNGTVTGSAPSQSPSTNAAASGMGMSFTLVGMTALIWALV